MNDYSCLDKNLSHQLVTPEYWNVNSTLKPLGIATGTTILIFFLIGLPSNILIIVSILLQKLYRQPTHLLLFSLACADILICLLVMPLIITAGFAGEFVFGNSDYVRCKVCQTGIFFVAITVFTLHLLALISVDRFIFIKFPLRQNRYDKLITKKAAITAVAVVSVLSVLLAILPLFGVGDIHWNIKTFSCTPRFDHKTEVTDNIHYLILLALECLLPVAVLFITNIWVLCIAQKKIKAIYSIKRSIKDEKKKKAYHETLKAKLSQEKFRKQLRLVRVFGILLISHIITWIPFIIRVIEVLVTGSDDFAPWRHYIVFISLISYPLLHPIIEVYFLPEIRKPFRSVWEKYCCKKKTCDLNNKIKADTVLQPKPSCCCSLNVISASLLPKTDITENS